MSRFLMHKYGLSQSEVERLQQDGDRIIAAVEDWRDENGLPAPNSSLVRGVLMSLLSKRDELERAAEAEAEGERRHWERRQRRPGGPWLGDRGKGGRGAPGGAGEG